MSMEPVAVVFSSNDSYAILLGVALCSVFENKKGDYPIEVFVIDGGISAKNKERLGILEKRYGFSITHIAPDSRLFEAIRRDSVSRAIQLPLETYYRVVIGRILPVICHKTIYIDVDTVVRGDLKELFTIDLAGKTLGAVPDCDQPNRLEHLHDLLQDTPSSDVPRELTYFNAGVLLIDMDRWRTLNVEQKLFRFMHEHPQKLYYHDQDALNSVLVRDIATLDAKYNVLAEHVDEQSPSNPFIVHFAGGGKPWYLFSALPYQSEYIHYVNKTPWKSEKYRKFFDVPFAKKYHFYTVAWWMWSAYKKTKKYLRG